VSPKCFLTRELSVRPFLSVGVLLLAALLVMTYLFSNPGSRLLNLLIAIIIPSQSKIKKIPSDACVVRVLVQKYRILLVRIDLSVRRSVHIWCIMLQIGAFIIVVDVEISGLNRTAVIVRNLFITMPLQYCSFLNHRTVADKRREIMTVNSALQVDG
jgi:hypothetical protein